MDDELGRQIENSRSMSINRTLVTYDLRNGVDFSHPRKTAEALAKVFFDQDAKGWFKVEDGQLKFLPGYKVEIIVTKEHNHKMKATLNDFLNDLKYDEILPEFSKQVNSAGVADKGISTFLFSTVAYSVANTLMSQQADRNRFLHELLLRIMSNTAIKYEDWGSQ